MLLALDAVRVLRNPEDHAGLFGSLTLVLHEGGHILWSLPGSEWLAIAGGPLTQTLAPLVAGVARQGDRVGASFMGFWRATSWGSTIARLVLVIAWHVLAGTVIASATQIVAQRQRVKDQSG